MAEDSRQVVQTTRKSLAIAEAVARDDGLKVATLADRLGMNRSTVHTHLHTLDELGYVRKSGSEFYVGPKAVELGGGVPSFELVEALRDLDGGDVADLAAAVGASETVVRPHLDLLEDLGYVHREGGDYVLGLKFLDIGGYRREQTRLYKVGEPKVNRLAIETGELVNLCTVEDGLGVYLYQSKGENGQELDTYVGFRCYLHTTAFGKAILAAMSEDRVAEILDRRGLPARTPETVTDRDDLFDRLDRIRDRGFALDDGERLGGLRCVAAPIETQAGEVLGAISVSAPASRMPDDYFREELPEEVVGSVNLIELDVNYG